jgi:hypothetical protein
MVAVMDEPLTTSEASRIAGVSEGTVRNWMKAGRLRHQTTPLGRLVDPIALADVIAAREREQRERVKRRQIGKGESQRSQTAASPPREAAPTVAIGGDRRQTA